MSDKAFSQTPAVGRKPRPNPAPIAFATSTTGSAEHSWAGE